MKNSIFTAGFILAANIGVFAQYIPNGYFENWSNQNGYNTPDNWATLNDMTASAGIYTVTKGTSSGNPYLKLVSQNVPGMGIMPGVAVSGTLDQASFGPVSGFAFDRRPVSLTGKYQHMASSANDGGTIQVYLTKWNTSASARDTVGSIVQDLTGMAMSWTDFTIPFTYASAGMPDSCVILVSASRENPAAGSYLYVDNLDFSIPNAGINTPLAEDGISVYPNPVQEIVYVDVAGSAKTVHSFQLTDMNGKVLLTRPSNGQSSQFLSLSGFSKGNYVLSIQTADGVIHKILSKP